MALSEQCGWKFLWKHKDGKLVTIECGNCGHAHLLDHQKQQAVKAGAMACNDCGSIMAFMIKN